MPLPIGKMVILAVRITLRPVNGFMIRHLKRYSKHTFDEAEWNYGYKFFVNFGQRSNRFEAGLNRIIIQKKGLGEVKKLKPELAFVKGVEYFNEIFFFYGLLFGLSMYQINQAMVASAESKARLNAIVE